MMKKSSLYSLQELPKRHPLREYRRYLVDQNGLVALTVNGNAIDLEMAQDRFTLLATSYDYFDGCHHWIYLLRDGKLIDQLCMPDQFGFIREVSVVSKGEIAFGYFGTNDRWRLVLSEAGFWSYSAESVLYRTNHFLLAKRHMSVYHTKGLPWSLKHDQANR